VKEGAPPASRGQPRSGRPDFAAPPAQDALAVILLYHVLCAGYAVQLASEVGHKRLMMPWFFQTLYLGWPSLAHLLARKRQLKQAYSA
jgi:hypothetical protein